MRVVTLVVYIAIVVVAILALFIVLAYVVGCVGLVIVRVTAIVMCGCYWSCCCYCC